VSINRDIVHILVVGLVASTFGCHSSLLFMQWFYPDLLDSPFLSEREVVWGVVAPMALGLTIGYLFLAAAIEKAVNAFWYRLAWPAA
jgi:hypothetical protein